MVLTPILGLLLSVAIFCLGVFMAASDVAVFINVAGVLLVVGLTVTASVVSTSAKGFLRVFRIFFAVLTKRDSELSDSTEELSQIYQQFRRDPRALKSMEIKNDFLRDCLPYLADEVRADDLRELLEKKVLHFSKRYSRDLKTLHAINRYPPAFGMLGTLIGLIALLQGLGGKDMAQTLGPNMAVALTTTLYGTVLSNLVLSPMIETIKKRNDLRLSYMEVLAESVIRISKKVPLSLILEHIEVTLPPQEAKKDFTLARGIHSNNEDKAA